jgi:4-hydroxy-3-methylbut-2-enyl diphosphate reductase
MRVIRAGVLGFCAGVRRAVALALEAAGKAGGAYTLGPLIHNPEVMETLRRAGVEALEEGKFPPDLEGAAVIIRAHGSTPALEAELRRRGARIVDATCGHVKASQTRARALSAEGCVIFLAGEQGHGEIIGIRGYVEGPCFVAADPPGAARAAEELARENPGAKTALLGQSTISPEEYAGIAGEIRRRFPGLKLINSICGATRNRQEALRELAGKVEALIIAGGRESANTRRLLAIAEGPAGEGGCGKPAWLVENAAGIPPEARSFGEDGGEVGPLTP